MNKRRNRKPEPYFSNEDTRFVADVGYYDKRVLAFCRAMLDDSDTMEERIEAVKYALDTGDEEENDCDLNNVHWEEIVEAYMALRWEKDVFRAYVD